MCLCALVVTLVSLAAAGPASQPASQAATLPATRPARPFRLLAFGDPQYSNEAGFKRWGDQLVAAEALKPDFAVALGDLTSAGDTREFAWYQAAVARPAYKVYGVPGNHDVWDGNRPQNYIAALGPLVWSFDHEGWHLLGYDSQKAQPAWLERDLVASAGKPVIFLQHYPPSDKQIAYLNARGVVLSLNGHVHADRRAMRNGVLDINVLPASNGFLMVDVLADGTIRAMWRPQAKPGVRIIYPGPGHAVAPGPVLGSPSPPRGEGGVRGAASLQDRSADPPLSLEGRGVRMLVDAYDTNREVERVEYDLGDGWRPMTPVGWRSWSADVTVRGRRRSRRGPSSRAAWSSKPPPRWRSATRPRP